MPRRKKQEQPKEEIKKIKTPHLLEGFKDILPADDKYWNFVENEVRKIIHDYSFRRVETPVLEKYELFNHTLFKRSGILDKESFNFIDKGYKVIMRPDATASVARAFIEHNMINQVMPVKLYHWGKMFRQGKIEEDKLRQFTQVSFEIIGDSSPFLDAELIILAYFLLKKLGIDTEVKLNSLGCTVCRPEYAKALSGFIKSKRATVCAECRKKATRDPFYFLNCTNNKCQRVRDEAPQMVDWLCDNCRDHLFRVLEYLDELKIPYKLAPSLFRNFDYYSKTVFELQTLEEEDKKSVVLVGGGRYDDLIEMLNGPSTPGAGFSLGIEKAINQIKARKVELPKPEAPDLFMAQISEQARKKAFVFYEELRKEGFSVKANFSKSSLKAQLDIATKMGAKLVLILGKKEASEDTILLRDVASGIQEVVNIKKVLPEIKKRLKEKRKQEEE